MKTAAFIYIFAVVLACIGTAMKGGIASALLVGAILLMVLAFAIAARRRGIENDKS
jgi:hypothetical protein